VVGDNVFVGQGATLQPEVKIYPGKNVEPGANVSLSLVWGRKWPGSLFGEDGITGLANIEITPEYALKLGAAYGAVLAKGAVVMCSRDAHPATRMLNRALNCGLLSVGVSVRDLQVLPATLARNAIKNTTGALGGVHCRVSGDDPRSILVEFYDADGIIIDRTMERKIENKFFREDFRRTTMDEVGVIDFPARTVDKYIEEFTQNLRLDVVKQAKFRVVIDYSYGCGSQALPSVLGKLGCEVVSLNAHLDPERSREQQGNPARALEQLASIVRTLKADFGARIDPSAERLTIVDETGRLIAESSLLVLFCLLVFRQVKGALVAVPVSAPSIIKTLAKQHGGRVIETRTDARSLTYTATLGESRIALAGTSYGGFVFPGFSPGFDAMFALARLLEMISAEKQPLSTLFSWVPDFQLNHFSVYCDFPNKGRVMRLLLEDLRDQRLELVDGLKVLLPDGWVLVVPDRSQPELQIWVEAGTEKACQELSREYEQKLSTLEARSREAIQSPVTRKITGKPSGKSAVPVTEDRAFHFWTPGRYLGVRARTLREFVDTLHYIEVESLRYHSERGDFANWLEYELGDIEMAKQIRALRSTGAAGEELRQGLLTVLTQEQEAVL
jgi:mannose-1-phosphate guanylyltransferase/phosphomannomutase